MRIAAVVVTYNRKDLLLECISSVLGQKGLAPDVILDVVVVDNASSDGTEAAVRKMAASEDAVTEENGKEDIDGAAEGHIAGRQILYFNTGSNLGGAGGFHYGIRKATELMYDYLWLMDDDCIPGAKALAALTGTMQDPPLRDKQWGFLSSKVLWKDGSICEMNVQRQTRTGDVKYFSPGQVRPVVKASFEILFVTAAVVKEVGLLFK